MIEGLTSLMTSQGWLAPAWYVAGFLLAALVPVIPTPLIAALGGTTFGTVPAILYGLAGLALGAGLALTISRQLGRRIMRRILPQRVWEEWEGFLGIRSYGVWFVVFFLLNLDIAVMAAGLSSLSARRLWWTAMAARVPWLIVAAWAGERVLVNDAAVILTVLVIVPAMWGVQRLRPRLRRFLRGLANDAERGAHPEEAAAPGATAEPDGSLHEAGVEHIPDGVPEKVEANDA